MKELEKLDIPTSQEYGDIPNLNKFYQRTGTARDR